MAALLLQELEPSEISKLPKTVQNKLEKRNKNSFELTAVRVCLVLASEQHFFEKVKQLAQCQEKLEDVKSLREKNREYESSQERLSSEQTLLSKAKEELEAEKRELLRTLEKRSLQVEHLNGMV
ncbi:hypothetical protein F7725_027896 [Dissostichus mawsoni]|uniref:Uncharacterized protein n=1 Tax=Dissostichus mawsoni TaxID=36200 RepID=A0A7J5XGK3_DISMA|nr:hypothetical protein F7725_027896 [Dissostichus mawsoni]